MRQGKSYWKVKEDDNMKFNAIVGNPPYVCARNMEEKSKILMKRWSVCKSGNPDLYIPFFQIATENLRIGGRIGLITMNSFLTSLNGRALREYFSYLQYDIRIVGYSVRYPIQTFKQFCLMIIYTDISDILCHTQIRHLLFLQLALPIF